MIVFVLVLLVVCAAAIVGVVMSSTGAVDISVFDFDALSWSTTAAGVFIAGVVAGAVTLLMLGLLLLTVRRARRKGAEHRALEARSVELERERAALAKKLGRDEDEPEQPPTDQTRFQPRDDTLQ